MNHSSGSRAAVNRVGLIQPTALGGSGRVGGGETRPETEEIALSLVGGLQKVLNEPLL